MNSKRISQASILALGRRTRKLAATFRLCWEAMDGVAAPCGLRLAVSGGTAPKGACAVWCCGRVCEFFVQASMIPSRDPLPRNAPAAQRIIKIRLSSVLNRGNRNPRWADAGMRRKLCSAARGTLTMDKVSLGNTGLKVTRVCLGTMTYGSPKWRDWVLDEEASRPFVRRALEAGINFFDTADVYSIGASEEVLGRALKDFADSRERIVVATKVCGPMGDDPNERGLSRKHIMHGIDNSLRRLGMDYVDLYQIHRFDPTTPIGETIDALDEVVRSGKARYIGASSMFAWQFANYLHTADVRGKTRFVSMQNHYNLIYREEEREMLPLCRAEGVGVIPWSPLARGFLAGNRRRQDKGETTRAKSDEFAHAMYYQESDFAVVDAVSDIASKRGVPNAQVALAWLLSRDGVTSPIVGASKMQHLEDAIAAASLILSEDEIKTLSKPYTPHRVLGHV
jgi:1-deoxyxylulose-5-phosphate synthase